MFFIASFIIITGDSMPDELLDVVNDHDVVVAQEMRSSIHQQGLQHRGVHVFLVTQDGRLLVQKRSRFRDNYPQALDCSVSEHVKAGEDYLQAAKRGLAEELGLHLTDLQPLVKFKMTYGVNDEEISLLYESNFDPAQVQFDAEEVEEVAYYTLDELADSIRMGKTEFCGWFIQLIRWYMGEPSELHVQQNFSDNRTLISTR